MTQQSTTTGQSGYERPTRATQSTPSETYLPQGSTSQSGMQTAQPQSGMQTAQSGMQTAQSGMQTAQSGMQTGGTLPQQYRAPLASVAEAVEVCGWCADQCIQEADPMMIECIRLCEDVVELGETVLATVPRNSRFSNEIVATFQRAAQACAQECGRHRHAHCQECATVLGETLVTSEQLIDSNPQQPR